MTFKTNFFGKPKPKEPKGPIISRPIILHHFEQDRLPPTPTGLPTPRIPPPPTVANTPIYRAPAVGNLADPNIYEVPSNLQPRSDAPAAPGLDKRIGGGGKPKPKPIVPAPVPAQSFSAFPTTILMKRGKCEKRVMIFIAVCLGVFVLCTVYNWVAKFFKECPVCKKC